MTSSVRNINQQFWSSSHISHLTVRTTYESTQGYKAHSHPELSIGIIKSGGTCLTLNDQKILLNQGDTILIEPHKVHACNPVNGIPRSYHMLYVDNAWCCELLSALYGDEVSQFQCDQEIHTDRELTAKLSELVDALVEQETSSLISEIDALLFRLVSNYCSPVVVEEDDSELAFRVKERLLADMANPPSIDELSVQLERPKESVIRSFKRRFGITPKSFLNNNRIEKAKYLLKCGMSIVDVANEVGYSDQSQFHRAFVSYTASTPGQYQQVASISDNNS
ncbi:AraC family transcriptional regulator [Vibrio sp. JC009]|uniref:AraC family transcriptional regulator n=1 Tax=Vibrio sp. JC009 TaxID=2912314 RepID=UPI0023B03BBF|nr:AraC family transcriptional regulator [Vibrio sp. JC009]WED23720.1 AraC family transcriptional regulator [Vibrio sp. JC009]